LGQGTTLPNKWQLDFQKSPLSFLAWWKKENFHGKVALFFAAKTTP
jgi:hypothetical protein